MDDKRMVEIGGFTFRRLRLPTGDVIQITGPGGGVYCDDSTVMQVLWDHIDAQAERIEDAERRMRDRAHAERTALEYAASKDERIKALETELEKRQSWLPMGACDEAMREAEGIARQETATAIARALNAGVERCRMKWRGDCGEEAEFVRWDEVQRVLRAHGAEIQEAP